MDNASDIHIEPMDSYVRLRYRIDGELGGENPIPLQLRAQITSRLKLMAGHGHRREAATAGRPHSRYGHQNRNIDFRVSTFRS